MQVTSTQPQQTHAPVEESQAQTLEVAPKVDDKLSPKFLALARQQKEILRRQQAMKTQEEAFKSKEKEYETSYIPKSRLETDTLSVLRELGFDDDKLAALLLNQAPPQEQAVLKMQKEIQDLRDAQQKNAQTMQEQQSKQYEQALNQIRNETKILIESNPEFETIKGTDSSEAVVELIRETFEKEQRLLTVEEAAQEVENYLLEEALKLASISKVKSKLLPQEQPVVAQPQSALPKITAKPQPQSPIKTLTNSTTVVSSKPLSSRDRRERAIAAFKGQQI